MILAREERSEESTPRLELSTTIRAAQRRDAREIVRGRNERRCVDLAEALRERRVEVLENFLPAERAVFDLVELLFHLRREAHVEDVGELLDHHLLDRFAHLGREEAALIQLDVAAIRQHRDDRRVRRWTTDAE